MNLDDFTLAGIAADYRNGALSPRQVIEQCQANYARHARSLDAYRYWAGPGLAAQADLAARAFECGHDTGPLQGMPCSVKDIYGVAGMDIFAGSPRALPDPWQRPGPMVRRLSRELAIVTGKTHTVEFAYGGLGTNPHWPVPINPWDVAAERVPGGSSAGAGVSLATGSALVALGTDTAGSVRVPASMTGQVGLKTTHGRWSLEGIVPLSPSLDTAGLLTRTVADMTYAFGAFDGTPVPERAEVAGLRIGVPDGFFWDDCDAGVAETVTCALEELEQAGARRQTLELGGVEAAFACFCEGGLVPPELHTFLSRELPEWIDTLDPIVRRRLDAGADLSATEYLARKQRFGRLGAEAADRLASVDMLAVPTVAVTPPRRADVVAGDDYARCNVRALRNTCIANLFGLCALTLPVGRDRAGLPVGLMLMARPWQEPALLAAAGAIERCLGSCRERLGTPPRLVGAAG
ncbi:amidase [Salinisphaera sp. T31B1]|uniref:amidase n=1 Tax=Salinisphaera sp. T31B1 TaxID=727963 RepID=UPI00333EB175